MITRDSVQGFIDGHKMGGHSTECLKRCAEIWLKTHPQYRPNEEDLGKILDDLDSYRK